MLGMHGTKTAAMTLSECDLMIVLGSRFSDRVLCNAKTFAKDKKIIHIDIDPAEIGKNIDVYSHVTGDVKYILAKLCELLPDMKHEAWMNTVMDWKKQYALRTSSVQEALLQAADLVQWATALAQEWAQKWATLTEQ